MLPREALDAVRDRVVPVLVLGIVDDEGVGRTVRADGSSCHIRVGPGWAHSAVIGIVVERRIGGLVR